MSDAATTIAPKAQNRKAANKASPVAVRRFNEARERTKAIAAPTLADVMRLAPNDDKIAAIVQHFGFEAGDYDELMGAGLSMIRDQYTLLEDVLVVTDFRGERNFKAMEMHLGRIVDGLIRSAYGAANFYENKRQIARDEQNSFSNESRDEDRQGIDGGENRVDRAVRFAAQQAPKAYALAVMAQGACDAYRELIGEDWKPYVKDNARSLTENVRAAQWGAVL
ncbi:hypothetical protein A0J51_03259 [Gluconobacter japonicus]|uniref:Uncharacterized protein n=1 Tax=Gluconobacter cerinus TaxID=38307 RepID=A0A1B6VI61_9PROT|nr:hypothetical protein [Gluconobacter cerinus]OAG71539.1 hypothetical protein A0J51_03259 [Gluconobacter japonicus]OAJ66904.1 hypothetical protein A0123_02441 [Gluconobacter cerinus]